MKKSMSMDLTALLDVILIILFAVMLNVSQTSKNTLLEQESLIGTIAEYEALLDQLETRNQELEQSLEQSTEDIIAMEEAYGTLEENFQEQIETEALYKLQQMMLLENLMDLRELSPVEQAEIIEAQTDSQLLSGILEELTINDTTESAESLIENLHNYTVIANKFLFLDATVNVDTGEFIFDNQPTGILINEDDGFNNHLFQMKKSQITDYMLENIQKNDRTFSFILITTSYNPYLTKRYYLNIIIDAIDTLRTENDAYIIFDTQYLTTQ